MLGKYDASRIKLISVDLEAVTGKEKFSAQSCAYFRIYAGSSKRQRNGGLVRAMYS